MRIGFVTGGMRNADQYGIEGAVWKQRGGFGGAVRSTLDSGAEGAVASFWAEGRHRVAMEWATGMAKAAVRMGTWRLNAQG